ncbi:unnamed protein product [Rodentolepis nana]|uniref:DUF3943 domain-containing protein n=1 Tax=Rodentolepis nana TaxID=102285 RepID=A0A0R3TW38_RODNA|nr:unnamed protein product [Rodentolepis nana]
MNKVSRIELFIYAAFYVIFIIGYQLYCKELEKRPYKGRPSNKVKSILLGFYNPQGTNYSEIVKKLSVVPYLLVYSLLCLIINVSNVPFVIEKLKYINAVLEKGSCGLSIHRDNDIFVWSDTDWSDNYNDGWYGNYWQDFREYIETTSLVYAGFYAHVIRAMLICCDYANSPEPISWKRLFSESIGFSAFTNVYMPSSFILFNDWKQWKDGKHENPGYLCWPVLNPTTKIIAGGEKWATIIPG